MVAPEITAVLVGSFLGSAGTVGIAGYRMHRRVNAMYRMLAGHDERENDGLIDQVEETYQLAQTNRRALRQEGIFPSHDRE